MNLEAGFGISSYRFRVSGSRSLAKGLGCGEAEGLGLLRDAKKEGLGFRARGSAKGVYNASVEKLLGASECKYSGINNCQKSFKVPFGHPRSNLCKESGTMMLVISFWVWHAAHNVVVLIDHEQRSQGSSNGQNMGARLTPEKAGGARV